MAPIPRRRPLLEPLEGRRLPATFGVAWPDPGHLTLSFVKDGTPVGSAPSALASTLDARMPTALWQRTILSAFQAWADLANINIGLVPDGGLPAGRPGPLQGNPNFGDIRVSARPLSADELAIATPFDLSGNWSGNVVLNSAALFSVGGANDLFSAVLHEAGHVFGLEHNPADPASAMYPTQAVVHAGPSASDAEALRALYGARQPDAFESPSGNDTFATATPLVFVDPATVAGSMPPSVDSSGSLYGAGRGKGAPPWVAAADISSLGDTDVYAVKAPAGGGALAAVVRAAGVSLLTARVTVYDASGAVVASASADDPLDNDVTVVLPTTTPGATYYVKVASANPDVFGIGAYRVAVGSPDVARSLAAPPPAGAITEPGKGTTFATAAALTPQTPGTDARWRYVAHQDLVTAAETDFYRVQTDPASAAHPSETLVVTVWGDQPGGFSPAVTIFNARGNPVPARVINRDESSVSVQVPAAAASHQYVIAVSAAAHAGVHATGAYTLAVNVRNAPVSSQSSFEFGTPNIGRPKGPSTFTVASSSLFHFDLSGGSSGGAVQMTVYDAKAKPVASLRTSGGGSASAEDVLLAPGTYFIRVSATTKAGLPQPRFSYKLRGTLRSDPIGPTPTDPTPTGTGTTTGPPPIDPTGGGPVATNTLPYPGVPSNPWP